MSPGEVAALSGVAFVASTFDAIAGGGGLLTLPALLLAGLDPISALATNKLQSSAGSVSATIVYIRRGLLGWPVSLAYVAFAGLAAAAGASVASLLPRAILGAAVPVVLVLVALYFAFARRPMDTDRQARMPPLLFAATGVAAIGFYDGIFGPGTGSFLTIGFVSLLGFGILRATAHAKLANAASNVGALTLFVLLGKVVWPLGLSMALASMLGGQLGSRLAIRHGARLIRPLLVGICCIMALRLLADPANPLHRAVAQLVGGG